MIILSFPLLFGNVIFFTEVEYAWFTMNKEVAVTGMQVKAHAEEGLLINEVATANDGHWDELATGGWAVADAVQLRPASTSDLIGWWHANSKKSYNEAGASGTVVDTTNTVDITGSGAYYKNIGSGSSISTSGTQAAEGGTSAETIVYYDDASFGTNGQYDNGEGYYVLYKYYLKSSKNGDGTYNIAGDDLEVKVTATKQNSENSGTSNNMALDKALRVGVKIDNSYKIFAPMYTDNQSYNVANGVASINGTAVTAYGTGASYVDLATNEVTFAIPNVTTNGKEVDVYVWFEGEDENCISDNITAVLDTYQIDINFRDASLSSY